MKPSDFRGERIGEGLKSSSGFANHHTFNSCNFLYDTRESKIPKRYSRRSLLFVTPRQPKSGNPREITKGVR